MVTKHKKEYKKKLEEIALAEKSVKYLYLISSGFDFQALLFYYNE